MCITTAVGPDAPNRMEDVKSIQVLLNLNRERAGIEPELSEDGEWGRRTQHAITAFQDVVMGKRVPDGRVDPAGATLKELRKGIPPGLSEAKLTGTMPRARREDIARFFRQMLPTLVSYSIDMPLRQAHFLAQIAHESGSLRYTEELASGEAYEGRAALGNNQPGDGRKFKGRGLIQLTGRANYEEYGEAKGIDFTEDGNWKLLSTDPQLALDVSCWFWETRGLNALADKDDVLAITRRINGGLNGLADREEYLRRSKFFLLPLTP